MEVTSSEANAWAAGLFEGEGSIEVNRPPLSRTGVRLHLNTTDLDVLERFAEVAGCGTIRVLRAPSIIRHDNWKMCWAWNVAKASECERLLRAWLPYLGQRRSARAVEAMALLDEKDAERWRVCYCGRNFYAGGQGRGHQRYCSARCRELWNDELKRMDKAAV